MYGCAMKHMQTDHTHEGEPSQSDMTNRYETYFNNGYNKWLMHVPHTQPVQELGALLLLYPRNTSTRVPY
jgi:hypothetical protein